MLEKQNYGRAIFAKIVVESGVAALVCSCAEFAEQTECN
jgi:hypothetical protein